MLGTCCTCSGYDPVRPGAWLDVSSLQVTLLDEFLPRLEQADTGERFVNVLADFKDRLGGWDALSQRDGDRLAQLPVPCRAHGHLGRLPKKRAQEVRVQPRYNGVPSWGPFNP